MMMMTIKSKKCVFFRAARPVFSPPHLEDRKKGGWCRLVVRVNLSRLI
ncbi:hypothetical protein ECH7EC4401_4976 [Escherichia coli O157:H7 str. EC4401]|nr:hypothetical protein ECH7EC4401_4976 [Escherichia coli O157:H7 str. EC4401]